jgi:hypothetical protein
MYSYEDSVDLLFKIVLYVGRMEVNRTPNLDPDESSILS